MQQQQIKTSTAKIKPTQTNNKMAKIKAKILVKLILSDVPFYLRQYNMYIVFIYTTTWAHLPRISQLSDKIKAGIIRVQTGSFAQLYR